MYLTGFADEAGADIDVQIRATKELGWSNIESRGVSVNGNGANLHDISDADFDTVCEKLEAAGVRVNCFGSTIANWGKHINKLDEDQSFEEARRAIPRMQKLGTKLIRVMSYAVLPDRGPDDQMEEIRFERVRELTKMFLDAGLQPVHENCMNYGGMGAAYTLRLLENVPGLKLVFDTGNPVFTDDRSQPTPCPKQSAWDFYRQVRDHIAYIHIKDGVRDCDEKGEEQTRFTFAGEGQGNVRAIVKDALDRGYAGGISMEPHLAVVFHDDSVQSEAGVQYANYIEYGKRFMQLLTDIGHSPS